jgi:CheY-like chemotaxis protein
MLGRSEVLVREAGSGPQAMREFLANSFDVIITDYSMEPMNGWTLAEQIRSHETQNETESRCRLILITGLDLAVVKQAHPNSAPFDRMLQKPVSHSTLLKAITG